ncbi:MAG: T9SS type A sorting domain-containing protein [Ignavibacteria bacterium]|nr:T9SS type A sorting domain-containing protein [Ignavibacteria bacterium]
MKKFFTFPVLGLFLLVILFDSASAQLASGNGTISFHLTNAGRVRISRLYPYVAAQRDFDRISVVAAWTQNYVFDYNEDSDSTQIRAQRASIPGVDTALISLCDNGYSFKPPKIKVLNAVMSWTNKKYAIVRYRIYNDTSIAMNLYIGTVVLPMPSGTYGNETVTWNSARQVVYFNRAGENHYFGTKLLSRAPYSLKIRDWDDYSSDPNAEVTTDSVRYLMTVSTGFDAGGTYGGNGSIFHLNAGSYNLNPRDSADVFYGFGYGTTADEAMAACEEAQAKYNSVFTSLDETNSQLPLTSKLYQNFPNPFNPETEIKFDIAKESKVTLKIYNTLGKEILTLVDEHMKPGVYSKNFNAKDLPSGIYFYRLNAGNFINTKKMVIVK